MKSILFILILSVLFSFSGRADDHGAEAAQYNAEALADDAPGLVMTRQTNGLESGLWIDDTNHVIHIANGKVVNNIDFALYNSSTNRIDYWTPWPRQEASQYQMRVVDPMGKELKKTLAGESFENGFPAVPEQTWVLDSKLHGLRMSSLEAKSDILFFLSAINARTLLEKTFQWDQAGSYKLHMVHRMFFSYQANGKACLRQISFPEVVIDIAVKHNNLKGVGSDSP